MKKFLKTDPVFFYILIRARNSYEYFNKCVDSVLSQTYTSYKILFVDDASSYNRTERKAIKEKLNGHVAIFNRKRRFAVYNSYHLIHKYASNPDAVVINLDGDDWLLDNHVLSYLASVYQRSKCLYSYGECVFWNDDKISAPSRFVRQYTNIRYPLNVVNGVLYRQYPFLPLHPRTWKVWLFKKIQQRDFLRADGSWLQFAEDQAIFYPMLEMAPYRLKIINKALFVYNIANSNSDLKKNLLPLLKDELTIRKKIPYGRII